MGMSMSAPVVAFCITCGNRLVHLKRTLWKNLQDNQDCPSLKVIVLDYSSTDGLERWILNDFAEEFATGRLVYYRYPGAPYFRMAHAKNMAHRLAIREGAEILVSLDADNWTGPSFANWVIDQFGQASIDGEAIFLRARENDAGPAGGDVSARQLQGSSGRIVVTAAAFLQAGGYDEFFVYWGPDDKDFSARLTKLGYARHGIPTRYLEAIWHHDLRFAIDQPGAPRKWGDAAPQFALRGRDGLSVANFGRFGMGGVFRNGSPNPVVLAAVPTRIFGIGMHRTATTSLTRALHILGLDAAHWESDRWAKSIVNEMDEEGRSLTLEAYYCLSDMPIGYLFVDLDRAYPGSKFILTLRNEEGWLKSVERHWASYFEKWQRDWFSNEMHQLIYGQTEFDAEVFLQRYRAHNQQVLDHFKNRPSDLLVMDMDKGAGWSELCAFVDRPLPDVPYPVLFTSASKDADGDPIS